MSTRTCSSCGSVTPESFVACPSCGLLFHADELRALDAQVRDADANGRARDAALGLRRMIELVPGGSQQATQLLARLADAERASHGAGPNVPAAIAALGGGAVALFKFGAPLLSLLAKGKFLLVGLTKLPTLLSMAVFARVFDLNHGTEVAIAVVLGIYVHETGHSWALHRYAIPVSPAMFIPGIGAFVRSAAYPVDRLARVDVALSGPLWGMAAGYVLVAYALLADSAWAATAAAFTAEINLFNLLAVYPLDGGRAVEGLSRKTVGILGGVALALGLAIGSMMGVLAGAGLLVRVFVRPPSEDFEPGALRAWSILLLGLFTLSALTRLPGS